jgi:predicted transposase/invertase (TIGR01784 family)
MKNIYYSKKLKKYLKEYLQISIMLLDEKQGETFLKSIIIYLFYASGLELESIINTFKMISEKGKDLAMTTASKLIEMGELKGYQKGIEKGIEKGKAEGKAEGIKDTVKKMLSLDFSMQDITAVTGLSVEEIEDLQKS